MNQSVSQDNASSAATEATNPVLRHDHWQRRFGVPWDRVDRAARAVLERAAIASRRRFADPEDGSASPRSNPG